MWRTWLLSSASSGIVAGFLSGISILNLFPGFGVLWIPAMTFISSMLGSLTQYYVLRQFFRVPLTGSQLATIGWMLFHAIAWTILTSGIGFITMLKGMTYQPSPFFDLASLLTYIVVGTVIGLISGGIQLLFWRRELRPQILWLALSWLGWVASSVLLMVALIVPYRIGSTVPGGFSTWITFFLTSLGIAIVWFAQFAIAGGVLVPALRNR